MAQVQSSGWMSWAKKDVTEELDYCQLDKLFSAEGDEKKKPNISKCVIACVYTYRFIRVRQCFYIAEKKEVVASLLDHTRSRNIEIFLPSFPLPVQSLDLDLDHQLNIIEGNKLNIEHIVALKRLVLPCICSYTEITCVLYQPV